MGEVREVWLTWLINRDHSAATVRAYGDELRYLMTWAAQRAPPVTLPEQLQAADLLSYQAERAHLSGAARKRTVAALRSFFGWARPADNPAKALPYPRVKRRKQRHPGPAEVLQVMAACDASPRGVRDLALLALLYDTGLRNQEACRLQLVDVDLAGLRLKVRVKGGHEHDRVFVEQTAACLASWLAVRATVARPECATFFCSVYRNRDAGRPLTPGGLRSIFRYIGRRAGLATKFSPHDMRRALARSMHEQNASPEIGMAAGGWASQEVYRGYIGDVQGDTVRRFSPMRYLMGR
jgi:site-specific recombinase XerD